MDRLIRKTIREDMRWQNSPKNMGYIRLGAYELVLSQNLRTVHFDYVLSPQLNEHAG
jgi:hypothetical protein